jgi:CBS domain-containing protein
MPASAIMTSDLVTLRPQTTVAEALSVMCSHRVHNLPVVDGEGCFVGLFSLRRVTRALLPVAAQVDEDDFGVDMAFVTDSSDAYLQRLHKLGRRPVGDLLEKGKKLRFCAPDTPIPKLLQLLSENPTSLPVVVVEGRQRKVVGMVSNWDVLTRLSAGLLPEGGEGAVCATLPGARHGEGPADA